MSTEESIKNEADEISVHPYKDVVGELVRAVEKLPAEPNWEQVDSVWNNGDVQKEVESLSKIQNQTFPTAEFRNLDNLSNSLAEQVQKILHQTYFELSKTKDNNPAIGEFLEIMTNKVVPDDPTLYPIEHFINFMTSSEGIVRLLKFSHLIFTYAKTDTPDVYVLPPETFSKTWEELKPYLFNK